MHSPPLPSHTLPHYAVEVNVWCVPHVKSAFYAYTLPVQRQSIHPCVYVAFSGMHTVWKYRGFRLWLTWRLSTGDFQDAVGLCWMSCRLVAIRRSPLCSSGLGLRLGVQADSARDSLGSRRGHHPRSTRVDFPRWPATLPQRPLDGSHADIAFQPTWQPVQHGGLGFCRRPLGHFGRQHGGMLMCLNTRGAWQVSAEVLIVPSSYLEHGWHPLPAQRSTQTFQSFSGGGASHLAGRPGRARGA